MVRCERRLDVRAFFFSEAPYLDHGGGRENVTEGPPNQIHSHTEGQYYQPVGLVRRAESTDSLGLGEPQLHTDTLLPHVGGRRLCVLSL